MEYQKLESRIIDQVQSMNGQQKSRVLEFVENIPKTQHNTRIYRRKALKQIREALTGV